MKYKFSPALHIDYSELKDYVTEGDDLTKKELLEKCSGNISRELLQYIRELEFEQIGKSKDGELYIW